MLPDPEAAMRFYGELFGWEFAGPGAMPGGSGGEYFVARLRGRDVAGVGSQPAEGASPAPAWTTYICVDSADDAAAKVKQAGGSVVVEPFDVLPAGRMAVVADPEGAIFCVWEAAERRGAQLVNEPGAWSMSALNTRDPEGATTFYREVFGWKTEVFDLGGAQVGLYQLSGYVGGEPEQPVPRDVVATMIPMGDETPEDAPPHWSVDFWVDDLDGATEAARRGGGTVVAPPYDIPGTGLRQSVVGDPQGAVFSVTKVTVPG
jgi:predicted enzyme related to lactoylglutathione lyase